MLTSKETLLSLFICQLIFYSVYYVVSSIAFAICGLDSFTGTNPFNFKSWVDFESCCSYSKEQIVNTVSMYVTYPVTGVIFGMFISSWVWDFSVTTSLLHIALSCLVMLDFPKDWSWWVSLGTSVLLMIGCGEGMSALRRWRNKSRLVVPEQQLEPTTYMCK
ncbi:hypothetical protein ACF0H5_005427 [Mactra antiquata]